ncbi:TIGR00153 family protein [bacterium]|nr:TIGR00153 family protein [bacterium]NBX72328.1 TIGR00153 family protein [bacterium]
MTNIVDIFGAPAFDPLNKHMQKVNECALELKTFFYYVLQKNWEKAKSSHDLINAAEDQADHLKEKIRMHVPKTLFMSIERSYILDILSLQDRIANKAKNISGLIYSRKMFFPSHIANLFEKLLLRAIDASNNLLLINFEIKKLISSGFRSHEARKIEKMIHDLDKIENDTDNFQIELREALFLLEKDMSPIEIVFLYKMIDWFGDLADRSQRCAHRVLLLIAD